MEWNPEQLDAIEKIKAWTVKFGGSFFTLTGAAGTGKTSILSEIKSVFPGQVAWTAMTGKAALRLSQLVGVTASTLHKVLYEKPDQLSNGDLEFNKIAKPECEYLVIDEASMMSPKIYQDLQTWVYRGIKILCVGDGYQLPPVMSAKEIQSFGEDFSIFREVKGPALMKVMRSDDDIIRIATMLREKNRVPHQNEGAFEFVRDSDPGNRVVEEYLKDRDDHLLVTWRNQLRMSVNREIRRRLGYKSPLPEAGEPVLMCKNGQQILNGETHIADSFRMGPEIGDLETKWMVTSEKRLVLVTVKGRQEFMDGINPDIKDWRQYGRDRGNQNLPEPIPITYGYVSTAHKAQGSEFRRVSVFLSGSDLRNEHFRATTKLPNGDEMPFATRFLYTSLTRAKKRVSLILG